VVLALCEQKDGGCLFLFKSADAADPKDDTLVI